MAWTHRKCSLSLAITDLVDGLVALIMYAFIDIVSFPLMAADDGILGHFERVDALVRQEIRVRRVVDRRDP
jgi:hypothetical protein